MMSSTQDDALLPVQFLTPDSIALTPAQVSQAIELARQATSEAEQWQTYLNSLALLGLQEWLDQRSSHLELESQFLQTGSLQTGSLQSNLPLVGQRQPALSPPTLSQQVSHCQIAQSRLQLLTTDCLADPLVAVPQPVGAIAALQPDFYLLVEVLEELSEVRLRGYLPQARFNAMQLEAQLHTPAPDLMLLPIEAFDADPAGLLLRLRAQLTAAIRHAQQPPAIALAPQAALNLRFWLQDRLDQLAESLNWQLIQPAALNLSGALMSSQSDPLNVMLQELQRTQGIAIPTSARAAERDLELGEIRLKLYVLTWEPEPDQWSLLLILGAKPQDSLAKDSLAEDHLAEDHLAQSNLPVGLTLKLEADQELLVEERLADAHPYLYSLVVGTADEQFRVTVTSPTGVILTLTPFGFAPIQPDQLC